MASRRLNFLKGYRAPLFAVLWLVAVLFGSAALFRHEFDGVIVDHSPSRWPDSLAAFAPEGDAYVIFMAVHPNCPCTRASLEQLDRLLSTSPERAKAVCLFAVPEGASADWVEKTEYWRRIQRMHGAIAVKDLESQWATLLGAEVSGTVVVYDAAGTLRFQGGLTASRGHDGSSRAMTDLSALFAGRAGADVLSAPAFGCTLESVEGES